MKHTEQYKFHEQLDAADAMPSRRVSKGGTLMIVFLVGVIIAAAIPVGFKLLTNSMLMTMAAHKPGQKIKATETLNETSSTVIDKTIVERPRAKRDAKTDKAQKVEKAAVSKDKEKATAAKKEAKPIEKAIATKGKAKGAPKAVAVAMAAPAPVPVKVAKVEPRLEKSETVFPKARAVESVMELPLGPNAAMLQQKAEEDLLSGAAVPLDVDYRTIYNASYSKEGLNACKQRCVLRIQDAKGEVQSAIINGPEFASILAGHNGTINVTGKKRLLKNYNVFVVQNITFNLTSGQGKQADVTSPAKPSRPGQQAKASSGADAIFAE